MMHKTVFAIFYPEPSGSINWTDIFVSQIVAFLLPLRNVRPGSASGSSYGDPQNTAGRGLIVPDPANWIVHATS